MFTGLIEEKGKIKHIAKQEQGIRFVISCDKVLHDLQLGDSIAVNGVCLTATEIDLGQFEAYVMPETLTKTHLASLKPGSVVHLERALAVGARLGGHFVQGHVDGVATLEKRIPEGDSVRFLFQVEESLTHWMIDKGSIAINGVSLTLVEVNPTSFAVSLIPYTLEHTHFGSLRRGDQVNIECDLVGKYLAKWDSQPVVAH